MPSTAAMAERNCSLTLSPEVGRSLKLVTSVSLGNDRVSTSSFSARGVEV
jgi:hypothetical protein